MGRIKALYKYALFSYLIDPLFYVSSIIMILFCSFRFFFGARFFVAGIGSSDLRPFFNSVPYISILTAPLLALKLRPLVLDDSVPLGPLGRFLSLSSAGLTAFAFPVTLMLFLPLAVSRFGTVDMGQCAAGFAALFLYGFSSLALSLFLFARLASTALPLILSSLTLAAVNFIHLLPLYLRTGTILSLICRKVSFAWHFDSFSKGILDSRNILYYALVSLALILLSAGAEYRRLGKKIPAHRTILIVLIFALLSLSAQNLYLRIDISRGKRFTVSKTSRTLLAQLDGALRITYFRSTELKNLYPQTEDVADYLRDFCDAGREASLTLERADEEKLKALGIQGRQIRHSNGTRTEYVTVYSAVLLQYLDKSSIIPFVLSTRTLEYDLAQRLQNLVTQKDRKVYLLCGNGRELSESYFYVAPWLSSRGFSVESLSAPNVSEALRSLGGGDEIAVFGTSNLSHEQADLLAGAIERGAKAFIATSPYLTSIEDEWKITRPENDHVIPYLNSKGFAFEKALVEDISCYPLTMESGSGPEAEYATVNYPLWTELQSQRGAAQGATVFWASPLALYDGAEALLYTTSMAWLQKEAEGDDGSLFLTNPFLIPKSARESGAENGQFVVGAKKGNISLVSDQFFLSSLMTGFISGEAGGDFRNYDYLAKELLSLRGDDELSSLMEKASPVNSLHKITLEEDFISERNRTIALMFAALPLFVAGVFTGTQIRRKKKNEKYR